MKYSLLKLKKSEFQKWDKLVDNSNEGTIFHKTSYLNSLKIKFNIYFVMKGNNPIAGITIALEPGNKKKMILPDYLIYNGLIFFDNNINLSNKSKTHSNQFVITNFVVDQLTNLYDEITLQLSPKIKDIRPFLWFNYHSDIDEKFKVDVRYTSLINIEKINSNDNLNENQLFKNLGYSRRQEIRYGIKNKVKVYYKSDTTLFFSLYKNVMKDRFESDYFEKLVKTTNDILEGLKKEKIVKIYYAENSNGEISSAAAFCWDSKRAYYLFGVNKINKDERYIGSFILWESFRDLQKLGIKEIDLEGINSPDRGWFKLSFGGNINPYYRLDFVK